MDAERRQILKSLAALSALPLLPACGRTRAAEGLTADPAEIMDLPQGFSYRVVSRAGDLMDDGFAVPGHHDGMAAFSDDSGRIRLVCNHELAAWQQDRSALSKGKSAESLRVYDRGGQRTPGAGGTTTTVYNPATGETESQFMSLAGTEGNCAGGKTPWGSWLSCEECFESPGTEGFGSDSVVREQRHGYVFEVPASSNDCVEPVPLKAMGRFEHEACAVHEASGVVYLTEDRHHSLFYRFIPETPGKLADGGVLQALAITGLPSAMTHNWSAQPLLKVGDSLPVEWITLNNVDPGDNDLRLRGAAAGAATFARGEGLCADGDLIAFTCTIGGPARLGQIFQYTPSPAEGTRHESDNPGRLSLVTEAGRNSLLQNADNLTVAPWGDLIVCEDTDGACGLIGIRPDGTQYYVAMSRHPTSELAGVCFSPDGETLFVNVQYPGTTLAISGDWSTLG